MGFKFWGILNGSTASVLYKLFRQYIWRNKNSGKKVKMSTSTFSLYGVNHLLLFFFRVFISFKSKIYVSENFVILIYFFCILLTLLVQSYIAPLVALGWERYSDWLSVGIEGLRCAVGSIDTHWQILQQNWADFWWKLQATPFSKARILGEIAKLLQGLANSMFYKINLVSAQCQ